MQEEVLHVKIEMNGAMHPVGELRRTGEKTAIFAYAEEYLNYDGAHPISISLPLRPEPFNEYETQSYFAGLLPEGFSRRAVAGWTHTDEDDYLSILKALGGECLGAIQILADKMDDPLVPNYRKLSLGEVQDLAAEGATKSTEILVETHLSLAGAGGKVGLYYDESEDAWYLPVGTAPSNYIVKQSHVRFHRLVLNEQLCMRAASALGITTPASFILNLSEGNDGDILYATERYDRVSVPHQKEKRSMPVIHRLHQEDFAQALGISAERKYEQDGEEYMTQMFRLLQRYSANPMEDMLRLWDQICFNILVGNTDAHIKNYGLLYSEDLRSVRLSPAYDLVSTSLYGARRELSMNLGGERDREALKKDHFVLAARKAGLNTKIALDRLEYIATNLPETLHQEGKTLKNQGFADAETIADKIIEGLLPVTFA